MKFITRTISVLLLGILIVAIAGCQREPISGENITNVSLYDQGNQGNVDQEIKELEELLSGSNTTPPADGEETPDVPEPTMNEEENKTEVLPQPTSPSQTKTPSLTPKRIVNEGELVDLSNLEAIDPDGDTLVYTYSKPLDTNGKWQTNIGDAGEYLVTITASDGELETTQNLLVVVNSVNKAPVISGLQDVTVDEGDTVVLDPTVSDEDGDDVELSYSGWMTKDTYTTTYDDAGTYTVTVTASDGKAEVKKPVAITVKNINRAPELSSFTTVRVKEGDMIKVVPRFTDPDGDNVIVTYTDPLDETGEWQTEVGDAGEYTLLVTASDGDLDDTEELVVMVEALNHPPVFESLADLTVDEGDTVVLDPTVSDEDGDDVELSYSGWMTEDTYTTTYDDAGTYTVTVTASDGKAEVSQEVTITVRNKNRPPQFT
ncbi:hypothetical protein HYW21_07460 [Candidatus Woesearchaeota archaeon]|nr:hypothetical protein [Candidatus Woesearchaeota archaeon]